MTLLNDSRALLQQLQAQTNASRYVQLVRAANQRLIRQAKAS